MKIVTTSPLPLGQDSWSRDITVLYRGFRALGHNAECVRLFSNDGAKFPGVLQVGESALQSVAFWKQKGCDLVVANTWGNAKYNQIISAIKESGSTVFIRLDSDGYNSPWNGFCHYLATSFHIFRERSPILVSATKALAKAIIYSIPQAYDQRMLGHLTLADAIGIESNGAYALFSRLLQSYDRNDLVKKLYLIRHPVVPEIDTMDVRGHEGRDDCIVAVGRWDSPQKDAPLLIKTLAIGLASNPTWRADIYGTGATILHKLVAKHAGDVKQRIHIHGPTPHDRILHGYLEAKICLFSSRYEGCPIAGEEALCMGCSLVGPPDVPSMQDLCAPQFGTLPHSRRPGDTAQALNSEIQLWNSGKRQPTSIATSARHIFSARSICTDILQVYADRSAELKAGL